MLDAVRAALGGGRASTLELTAAEGAPGLPGVAGPAGRFDLVVAGRDVLAGVPTAVEQEHVVHRTAALVRAGGHLVVQVGRPGPRREDLARWASAAGLRHRWTTPDPAGADRAPSCVVVFAR